MSINQSNVRPPAVKPSDEEAANAKRCRDAKYHVLNREKRIAQGKARYEKNKSKHRAATKEWAASNADKMREYRRRWKAKNRDKVLAQNHRAYQSDPERFKDHSRRYRRDHPEKISEANARWRRDNPAKATVKDHARRARLLNAHQGDKASINAFVKHVKSAARLRCYWCGKSVPRAKRHIDHIAPLARGGSHAASNLCCACIACNLKKSAKPPEVFSGQFEMQFGDAVPA